MSFIAIYSSSYGTYYIGIHADDEIAAKQKALKELARIFVFDSVDRKLIDVVVSKSSSYITYRNWLEQS